MIELHKGTGGVEVTTSYWRAGPGQSEAPHPLPVCGMCIPPAFPVLEAASGTQP